MYAKIACHIHAKTVFGVFATRNDIRAIDTNFHEIGLERERESSSETKTSR